MAITDATVVAALEAATAANQAVSGWDPDPLAHRHHGYPISHERGQLLYLLARAVRARRVVEFATSIGVSTIYLATAVRDNGGGTVIGAEIVPEKVTTARANVAAAGLADLCDIREGDALTTLVDLGGPVDLVLLDGWPTGTTPSIDRRVLPQMRTGTVLFDDNQEPDVTAYLRDPANGFCSVNVALHHASVELALRVG